MLSVNLGDVPTWLAVVTAAAAGWIALRQLRQQQNVIQDEFKRNRARDELLDHQIREAVERENFLMRRQAEEIEIIWDSRPGAGKSIIQVVNASKRPIKYVTCHAGTIPLDSNDAQIWFPVRMGEMRASAQDPSNWVLIAHDTPHRQLRIDGEDVIDTVRGGTRAGFELECERTPEHLATIAFSDDAGLRWELSQDMHLTRHKDANR